MHRQARPNEGLVYCGLQGIGKERDVAEVKYVSKVRLEPVEGKIRRAYLPVQEDPVLFGVHSEIAEHYGVPRRTSNPTTPRSTTWSPPRAADCSAPFRARWQRVGCRSRTSTPRRSERSRSRTKCSS